MEIWIRSQNKEQLANITGLILVDNEIRGFTNHQDYYELGTYKTKERALEVLDEIQNILKPKYILDSSSIKPDGDSWAENGMILQKYNANARVEELSTYVYEMPEE